MYIKFNINSSKKKKSMDIVLNIVKSDVIVMDLLY